MLEDKALSGLTSNNERGMLMITSLTIENFRGIKALKLNSLGQVNVIAGKNNASKSSVLEGLSLLLAALRGVQSFRSLLQEILIWRGWYGPQTVEDLFHVKAESVRIVGVQEGIPWMLTLTKEMRGLNALPTFRIVLEHVNEESPKLDVGFQMHNLVDSSVLSSFLLSSKFDSNLNFEFITPLTLRKFGYVESLYSYAYEKKVVKDSVKILKGAYPEVEGFSPLFKANKWILHVETEYGVYPYYLMGEGFKNAMIIAFLSSLLRGGCLIIDSAEAFHHPKSLRVMAKTLLKGAKENNVQVFLTTHSLELIDILLEDGLKKNIDGRVIYMKREGGNVKASIETFEESQELRKTLGVDLRG